MNFSLTLIQQQIALTVGQFDSWKEEMVVALLAGHHDDGDGCARCMSHGSPTQYTLTHPVKFSGSRLFPL